MGAACEITRKRVGKDGRVRDRTSPFGEIKQHQVYALMAAYKIKPRQQWHLEQFNIVFGLWARVDRCYMAMVAGDFDAAVYMAKRNPKMFQVVFRDEFTGEERKVDARRKVLRAVDTLLPSGGPFIVRPDEPTKRKGGLNVKPPKGTTRPVGSLSNAMADAFVNAQFVGPHPKFSPLGTLRSLPRDVPEKIAGMWHDGSCYIAP